MQLGKTYRDQAFCDTSKQSGWNAFSAVFRTLATWVGGQGGGDFGASIGASVPDSCTNVWIKDIPGNVYDHRSGWGKENGLFAVVLVLIVSLVILRKL